MQNDSAAVRACLHTANMSAAAKSTVAEDTPAEHSGMMAVQESCKNAILQEYCSSLDCIMKKEDKLELESEMELYSSDLVLKQVYNSSQLAFSARFCSRIGTRGRQCVILESYQRLGESEVTFKHLINSCLPVFRH